MKAPFDWELWCVDPMGNQVNLPQPHVSKDEHMHVTGCVLLTYTPHPWHAWSSQLQYLLNIFLQMASRVWLGDRLRAKLPGPDGPSLDLRGRSKEGAMSASGLEGSWLQKAPRLWSAVVRSAGDFSTLLLVLSANCRSITWVTASSWGTTNSLIL